jgi:hypothetical protein
MSDTAGTEGRFLSLAPGQRLAHAEDFVLVHLSSVVAASTADALLKLGIEHGTERQLAILYFVERSGVGMPDAQARAAWTQLSRSSEPYYAASSLVVQGGGLAAATANAFVLGVRALSGGRLPLAIFDSVPPALSWLRQASPSATRLPSDDRIERMIARLRAME